VHYINIACNFVVFAMTSWAGIVVHTILMCGIVAVVWKLHDMQSSTEARELMHEALKKQINPSGFFINPDTVTSEIPAITLLLRGACDFGRFSKCIIHAHVRDYENRGLVQYAYAFYESADILRNVYGFDINVYFRQKKSLSVEWVELGRLSATIHRVGK
jgi:hypothetical protein